MTEFRYSHSAQQIIFGAGSIEDLAEALDPYGLDRILLCTIPRFRQNGLAGRVEALLEKRWVGTYAESSPHVPQAEVDAALQAAVQHEAEAVIALGGGSPIGLAKAVSMALEEARTGTPAQDGTPADQPLVSVIAIPTTYSGSEITPIYGITRPTDGKHHKFTFRDPKITPRLVIYDPELTFDLPPAMTASSGINALAHCIEAVYSIERNPIATAAALAGVRRIDRSLERAVANGRDLAARTELLEGAYLAGTAIATTKLGLHHGLCHVLGGTAGVPHGIANAVILPHAIRFNAAGTAPELAQVAGAMGLTGTDPQALAEAVAVRVYELIAEIGLPQRLRDVGIAKADLSGLARAALSSAAVLSNPVEITDAAQVESVYQAAY